MVHTAFAATAPDLQLRTAPAIAPYSLPDSCTGTCVMEQILHHVKHVFDLRADARPGVLPLLDQLAHPGSRRWRARASLDCAAVCTSGLHPILRCRGDHRVRKG